MRGTFGTILAAASLLFCVAAATPGNASGGGGGGAGGGAGGGGGGSAGSGSAFDGAPSAGQGIKRGGADLTTCPRGSVWDRKHRNCLQQRGGVLPDDDLAEYAYALAKADRYQDALDVLDLLQDPETPKALNYRGYATRKLGDTDKGIAYYLKSVELAPQYAQVREYLGEAYVIKGKLDLAQEQLKAIEHIQGKDTEEYEDLETAIEAAPKL